MWLMSLAVAFALTFSIAGCGGGGGGGGGAVAGVVPAAPGQQNQTPANLTHSPFDPSRVSVDPATGLSMVSNQVVLRFSENATQEQIAQIIASRGARIVGVNSALDTYQVELPDGTAPAAFSAEVVSAAGVVSATPNFLLSPIDTDVPNDPVFSDGGASAEARPFVIVRAPEAWAALESAGNPLVAVLDTGVDLNHTDLAGRVVTGRNFVSDTGASVADDNGHGTAVAGVIAAAGDNGAGMAGMCWNCRLLVVKVCHSSGSCPLYSVLNGITYAVSQGADVVNISLGESFPEKAVIEALFSAAMQIDAAGAPLFVAPAGNGGAVADNYLPAAATGVISVGAVSNDGARAAFSNFGSSVDVSAPGDNVYTTAMGGAWAGRSGTSIAAGFVSGLAGMLLSANSTISSADIRAIIESTAAELQTDQPVGAGRIDAFAALLVAEKYEGSIDDVCPGGDCGGALTTGIEITPEDAAVEVGKSLPFFARVRKADGSAENINPEWSVDGGVGTITTGGIFTATVVGVGKVIAKYAGDTAEKTVTSAPALHLKTATTSSTAFFKDSAFTIPAASYLFDDNVYVQVTDADENEDTGAREILYVLVSDGTTDIELVKLTETGNDTGVFRNTTQNLSISTVSGTNNDRDLQVVSGATMIARYEDTNEIPQDVSTASALVNPSLTDSNMILMNEDWESVSQYQIGESIYIELHDTDQNLNGSATESFTVSVTSTSGDVESNILLTETGRNTGVFRNTTSPLPTVTNPNVDEDGQLYVTTGSTLTATYTDPDDPTNPPDTSSRSASIIFSSTKLTNISWTLVDNYTVGDRVYVEVLDVDQNIDPNALDTLTVRITDSQTGDWELVTLQETGVNSNTFHNGADAPITSTAASGADNGTLSVIPGSVVTATYTDPDNPSDVSLDTVTMKPLGVNGVVIFTDIGGTEKDTFVIGAENIYIKVVDGDQNMNGASFEGLSVTVTVSDTGDVETVSLTETGANSGEFRLLSSVLQMESNPIPAADGLLQVQTGSVLTVTWSDTISPMANPDLDTDTATVTPPPEISEAEFQNVGGNEATQYDYSVDSVYIVISDDDQNMNAGAAETIWATVTASLSGDTELIQLTETGTNSGVFKAGGIALSRNPSASPGNGTLEVMTGTTLTLQYIDPDDPADNSADSALVVSPFTACSISTVFPDMDTCTAVIGERITYELTDLNRDTDSGTIQTVDIALVTETGDTESLTLTETDVGSGIFKNSVPTYSSAAPTQGNGLYEGLPLAAFTGQYTDTMDPDDYCFVTVTMSSSSVGFVMLTGTPCVPQYVLNTDTAYVLLGDKSRNINPALRETMTLTILNAATGDSETVTLLETGVNTGVFASYGDPVAITDTPSGVDDGTITCNVGDTITVSYVDPVDPADQSMGSANILPPPTNSVLRFADSGWNTIDTHLYGTHTSMYVEVDDADQNLDANATETVNIKVESTPWGDTEESILLTETGANTGVFRNTTDPVLYQQADGGSDGNNNGILRIEVGSVLKAGYTDPNEGWDTGVKESTFVRLPSVSTVKIMDAGLAGELPILETGDSVYIQVTDLDQDVNSMTQDTITVKVRSIDEETVTLTETGVRSGVFTNSISPLPTSIAFSPSGDGTLHVFYATQAYVVYIDPTDPADYSEDTVDITQKPVQSVTYVRNATYTMTVTEITIANDGVYVQVDDMDQNFSMTAADTVTVTLTAGFTGDTETLTLTEADLSVGMFRNTGDPLATSQTPGAPDDGTLQVFPGSIITATYTDPTDPTDTSLAKATAVPTPFLTSSVFFTDETLDGTQGLFYVELGDNLYTVAYDPDQNRNIQQTDSPGTVLVESKDPLTEVQMDLERIMISEIATGPVRSEVSANWFGNATDTLRTTDVDNDYYDDSLYALAGSKVWVTYTDPVNGDIAKRMVTCVRPPVQSVTTLTNSVFDEIGMYNYDDEIYMQVNDLDQDTNSKTAEANLRITLQCVNGADVIGEIANIMLTETADSSGVFRSTAPITMSMTGEEGKLPVQPGCSVKAKYTDGFLGAGDTSEDIAAVLFSDTPGRVNFIDPDNFTPLSILTLSDQINIQVEDIDENDSTVSPDPAVPGSFTVVVQTLGPDGSTVTDQETIALVETGDSTGIFSNTASPLQMATDTGIGFEDGILNVAVGSTLVATYTDNDDAGDTDDDHVSVSSAISNSSLRAAGPSWGTVGNYEPDDEVYIEAVDSDEDRDGLIRETVIVLLNCCYDPVTGAYESVDTDWLTLKETDLSTGKFQNVDRTLTLSETSGDGDNFMVRLNTNIKVTYTDENDLLDSTQIFVPVELVYPNPPALVSAEGATSEIRLTWTPPTTNTDGSPMTDLDGFNIYRSATPGGPYDLIYTEPDETATTYVDNTGLSHWVRYYYVMTAYNRDTATLGGDPEESANSAERIASLKPEDPLLFVRTCGCKKPGEPFVPLSTPGYLNEPYAITLDGAGNIYVADTMNNRVQKFDVSGGECVFQTAWGSLGAGSGEFQYPTGIAHNPLNGRIYVADYHDRVQSFTAAGAFASSFGVSGAVTVEAGADGTLYVTRSGAGNGVYKYSPAGASQGSIVAAGTSGAAVDGSGNVYITDINLDRIRTFDTGGNALSTLGAAGDDFREFANPRGIAVSPGGEIFVADTENNRVQVFDSDMSMTNLFGEQGLAPDQFKNPMDIAIDSTGRVFVVDKTNNCIKEYQPDSLLNP